MTAYGGHCLHRFAENDRIEGTSNMAYDNNYTLAIIGFKSDLWRAAEYKHVVLGLISRDNDARRTR